MVETECICKNIGTRWKNFWLWRRHCRVLNLGMLNLIITDPAWESHINFNISSPIR